MNQWTDVPMNQLLRRTCELASQYLESVAARRVTQPVDFQALLAQLGGALPENGETANDVIEQLAACADPAIVATAGPRYFGFVVGGSLPAALAADWLTSA